jgi:hypothetical protein
VSFDRQQVPRRDDIKDGKRIMEILEAYDLTKSFRLAAELAGCDHKTVKLRIVAV